MVDKTPETLYAKFNSVPTAVLFFSSIVCCSDPGERERKRGKLNQYVYTNLPPSLLVCPYLLGCLSLPSYPFFFFLFFFSKQLPVDSFSLSCFRSPRVAAPASRLFIAFVYYYITPRSPRTEDF
ncbi:hypothetical protein EDC04DRAFT_1437623 [Pisolithus marmoratus]|nr:hypothetical protein EDC04DRAFT_1437623 [Pisolithus marmoratus]